MHFGRYPSGKWVIQSGDLEFRIIYLFSQGKEDAEASQKSERIFFGEMNGYSE